MPSLSGDVRRFAGSGSVPRASTGALPASARIPLAPAGAPRVLVLGDLMLDVVVAPGRPVERGTDVPGRVLLRQGGSAATTARWLARLGARTTLVCAIGRDGPGRALTARVAADGVRLHAIRVTGQRTGRVAVIVGTSGERSFVTDRAAADRLAPGDLRAGWFERVDLLHLPAYSLLAQPLAAAARAAATLARSRAALVSIDLASIGPLLAMGRAEAESLIRDLAPDVLFATESEARSLLPGRRLDGLVNLAQVAVVKRGPKGAIVLIGDEGAVLRFDVATRPIRAADTTGAGDAFDAGFIAAWLRARAAGVPRASAVQRATLAGHRVAARHLAVPLSELSFA